MVIKLLTPLLLIIPLILMVGCDDNPTRVTFQAIVLEVNENNILVQPVEGSQELTSSDKIMIHLKDVDIFNDNNEKINQADLKVNQVIEITYDGLIAESYPAQIMTVYQIKIITDE